MAYDLTGKIKLIQQSQTFASGFTKREFVVTVEDGKYPQDIALECIQEKTGLLDGFEEGQAVKVTFDIRGREYNGRYFNNLQAWRIQPAQQDQGHDDERPPDPDESDIPVDLDNDPLPF